MLKLLKILLTLVVFFSIAVWYQLGRMEPAAPTPIEGEKDQVVVTGEPAIASALPFDMPPHPFMASQGVNGMHGDSYSSDVHPGSGPLGNSPQMTTRDGSLKPGGQCATITFDSKGRLVALCTGLTGFNLHLLAPRTLELLAQFPLPIRPSTFASIKYRDKSHIMDDSSGAYFYLDNQDRVVFADSEQKIRRIGHRQNAEGQWEFYDVDSWDLSSVVPHDCITPLNWSPEGECDPITAVMPDHHGAIWFVTRRGRYGVLDVTKNDPSQAIKMAQFENEEIQNGFSVARDGVYIVSDHALYRMATNAQGEPSIIWKESYDRGTTRKVGSINQGSGSTPTLLGERYVTITDNADGRINLLVYLRDKDVGKHQSRLICKLPLFNRGSSATDNSMIGFNRSIIVENNAGYTHAMGQTDWGAVAGGITRVDIREDETGCDVVWQSNEKIPSVVAKLSAQTGLAYYYGFEPRADGENEWLIKAIDFRSGKTQFTMSLGSTQSFDNNWSPITIAPDGTIYVGVLKGLVAIWDNPATAL